MQALTKPLIYRIWRKRIKKLLYYFKSHCLWQMGLFLWTRVLECYWAAVAQFTLKAFGALLCEISLLSFYRSWNYEISY